MREKPQRQATLFEPEEPKLEYWRLHSYDVWGNRKDGFQVNQEFRTSYVLRLPRDVKNKELVRILRAEGYVARHIHLDVDGNEDDLYIENARTGEPLFALRKES